MIRSDRSVSETTPSADVDFTSTKIISAIPGASNTLVGALLRTAAASVEAAKTTPSAQTSNSWMSSVPISSLVAEGVQQLESLDISGMDSRLDKLNAALLASDIKEQTTPSVHDSPNHREDSHSSIEMQFPRIETKERRSRSEDKGES